MNGTKYGKIEQFDRKAQKKAHKGLKTTLKIVMTTLAVSGATYVGLDNDFNVNKLPSVDAINKAVDYYDANDSYISIMSVNEEDKKIVRCEVFNNEPIRVFYSNKLNKPHIDSLKIAVQKYNDLFKVINPCYKFEIEEMNNQLSMLKKNSIYIMKTSEDPTREDRLNYAGVNYSLATRPSLVNDGFRRSRTKILINDLIEEYYTDTNYVRLFEHELFHSFGIGDLYLDPDVEDRRTESIMGSLVGGSFKAAQGPTKNDVKLLIALYGDITKQENIQKYDNLLDSIYNYDEYVNAEVEKKQNEIREKLSHYTEDMAKDYLTSVGETNFSDTDKINIETSEVGGYCYESLDNNTLYKMNGRYGEIYALRDGQYTLSSFSYSNGSIAKTLDDDNYLVEFGKYLLKIDTTKNDSEAISAYNNLSSSEFYKKQDAMKKQAEENAKEEEGISL